MDIVEFAEDISEKVDAFQNYVGSFFWNTFLLVQIKLFEPINQIGENGWVYFPFTFIAVWIVSCKFSGILPGEKSWQLFIIRTLIAKSFLFIAPLAICSWLSSAYWFSGTKLADTFFNSVILSLKINAIHIKKGATLGVISGLFLVLAVGRYLEPAIDRWLNKKTNKASKNEKLNDVRNVHKDLPNAVDFDPYQFFEHARKICSLFFGKDANNNCIYIPRSEWNNSNILLLGPTRRGKGIQAAMVLAQCLFIDDPDIIIIIDPKLDDWGPLVLKDACKRAGLPFIYVNARRGQPLQFNVLMGASKDELISLLAAGYDLHPKGSSDDHYRNLEVEAVEQLIEECSENPTIRELYELSLSLFNEKEAEGIQSLLAKLKQDSKLDAINAKQGPSFDQLLNTGGVFWFVGSEDDPSVVRVQRIFSYRAVQFFRNREDKRRHGTIWADELKYVLSGPFFRNFGTILGSGNANILASIQSKGDLEDIPQNLNPSAVSKAVFDNTNLKWIYRTNDPETVDWVVAMEGSQVVSRERHTVERNMQLAETASSERSVTKEEVSYLHRNHVLHLPNACAIMIGYGIAKFAYTSPIKVKKEVLHPTHVQKHRFQKDRRSLGDDLL